MVVFSGVGSTASYNLIFGHMGTTDTAYHAVAEFMAERAAELTDGDIRIEVYPNAELGNELDMYEQLMMGVTDLTIVNPGVATEFAPSLNFFNFPFLFNDHDHWERVFTSRVAERLSDRVQAESGVILIGYVGGGERFVVSRRPITDLSGFDGFLMRLAPADIAVDTWSRLGVSPTVIAYGEIYSALQLGVIDGLENEPEWILRMRFYEQAPYLVRTAHEIVTRPIVMSSQSYESLPGEYQELIMQIANEAAALGRELGIRLDRESLDELVEEHGVTVFDTDIDRIRELTAPVVEENAEALDLMDLVEEVRAMQ